MKVVEYTYHNPNVTSSALSEIWYSSTSRELFVRFRDSGTIAGYADVSPVALDKLMQASSVGSHFSKYIKNAGYKGVNSDGVQFRSAPGLAKKNTDVKGYTLPTPTPAQNAWQAKDFMPSVLGKYEFTITGKVLKTVEEKIRANTMEEAINLFKGKHGADTSKVQKVALDVE